MALKILSINQSYLGLRLGILAWIGLFVVPRFDKFEVPSSEDCS